MVVLNSQYGFIDHTGQIQIPFKNTAAHSFEQECARVCHDGLWGLIDRQRKLHSSTDLQSNRTIRGRISPRLTTQQSRIH